MTSPTEPNPLWSEKDSEDLVNDMNEAYAGDSPSLGSPRPYDVVYLRRFHEFLARKVRDHVIQSGGSVEDGRVAEGRARVLLGIDWPGTESSSSTSSASSQPAARSGTSSRSLHGLLRSWLAECLPSLLFATSESTRRRLIQGSASGGRRGTST